MHSYLLLPLLSCLRVVGGGINFTLDFLVYLSLCDNAQTDETRHSSDFLLQRESSFCDFLFAFLDDTSPDKRGSEDNSKIIFRTSHQKCML